MIGQTPNNKHQTTNTKHQTTNTKQQTPNTKQQTPNNKQQTTNNHFMNNIAISINKIPIRLSDERWKHISIGHPEMAEYFDQLLECVENPEIVCFGSEG
jgi:hypothetical protein